MRPSYPAPARTPSGFGRSHESYAAGTGMKRCRIAVLLCRRRPPALLARRIGLGAPSKRRDFQIGGELVELNDELTRQWYAVARTLGPAFGAAVTRQADFIDT